MRSPKNRTIEVLEEEKEELRKRLLNPVSLTNFKEENIEDYIGTINDDMFQTVENLPREFVDLLILDPPYNLDKNFHGLVFSKKSIEEYNAWLDKIICALKPLLKKDASIYICGEWLTSHSIFSVASSHFKVKNRITWEREKGRGSSNNWKSSSEDIWFCTLTDNYTFNAEAVKIRKKVIAPYKDSFGLPKDWTITQKGQYRDTYPSNFWTDITVPFWSMSENTDHPTQKSEKTLAKLILASSNKGDFIFDPFLGSGTTSVVAKKTGRKYLGIEINEDYCLLAEKRLSMADKNQAIQGFFDDVFWERNSRIINRTEKYSANKDLETNSDLQLSLFD
jgi:site-specific DNA-methyltransferase (adenine-specific)